MNWYKLTENILGCNNPYMEIKIKERKHGKNYVRKTRTKKNHPR